MLSALPPLHANQARIFPVDSEVYQAIRQLYVVQALSLPSTAGPWSQDELSLMFDRIDEQSLTPKAIPTYEYIRTKLFAELPSFSFGTSVALESYIHTNATDFTTNDDWYYNHDKRKALLSLPMEISLANHFYAYAGLELTLSKFDEITSPSEGTSVLYGKNNISTNMHLSGQIDANVPYRAFGAWGGEGWLLQVGRDKLSWGPGTTGNFLLGDHLQYHNQGRFTAYDDTFKYTFVTSFFPHPDEIWGSSEPSGQGKPLVGLKMFMAHRFEWRLFDGKVGFSLNEAIMYQPKNGAFDLRILNPMMLYHNYFIRSDANSIASLEFDIALVHYWNLYGQLAIDELSFGATEENLSLGQRHPDGVAYMLGLEYAQPVAKGILFGSLEGVYTDPYLYLRSIDGDKTQEIDGLDSLNFVVALRRWFPDNLVYDQDFIGYRYGGDAIVGNLEVGYKQYASWSFSAHLFCMLHGEIDMNSLWILGDLAHTPTGDAKAFIDAGISGTWNVTQVLQGYAGIDLLSKVEAWKPTYDLQLYMGVQYTH
ncbi:MAG: hypothetical protein WBI82_00835 [Sphaerochaeta sp.]